MLKDTPSFQDTKLGALLYGVHFLSSDVILAAARLTKECCIGGSGLFLYRERQISTSVDCTRRYLIINE